MPTPTRTITTDSQGQTIIKNEGQGSNNSELTREQAKRAVETLTKGDQEKREKLEKESSEAGRLA